MPVYTKSIFVRCLCFVNWDPSQKNTKYFSSALHAELDFSDNSISTAITVTVIKFGYVCCLGINEYGQRSNNLRHSWYFHTPLEEDRKRDRDLEEDQWILVCYAEMFTLIWDRDRNQEQLFPVVSVAVPGPPQFQPSEVWISHKKCVYLFIR